MLWSFVNYANLKKTLKGGKKKQFGSRLTYIVVR